MKTQEHIYLSRALALAEEALEAGDEPFGSVLVSAEGEILAEDRNRIASGDATQHPEFTLARWAAQHMTLKARASATVYTTGEHCPMCAAAHGWAGLGRIVYISSSEQLGRWLADMGVAPSPVKALPIKQIVPTLEVEGPIAGLDEKVHALHQRRHAG
ncbi:MAG: nucleoside deaminase [Halomonas sp.]|nr:nucleoside deaminase [Halomonas sp.]MBP5979277.1 nucleoside deaminase [Halomonas sp.]